MIDGKLTTKSGTLPHTSGDQLERSGGNLRPSSGNAQNGRGAPTLVAGFQCLAHYVHVSDTLKGEVTATVSHADDDLESIRSVRVNDTPQVATFIT